MSVVVRRVAHIDHIVSFEGHGASRRRRASVAKRLGADAPTWLHAGGATGHLGRALATSGGVNRSFVTWALRCLLVLAMASGLSVLAAWLAPGVAHAAFTPPPLVGHVVDVPGALTTSERQALDRKLDTARKSGAGAVVVFVTAPLDGVPIEDVAYDTFNAWGVGASGKDDGVLLVVSPADRKLRIETGKGVGGAITDVQSSHINRDVIGPELAAGHTYAALDHGTDAILALLRADAPPPVAPVAKKSPFSNPFVIGGIVAFVVLLIVLNIVSETFRRGFFAFLQIFAFILDILSALGGGGGGGSSGGGYRGGGGKSGGGGSSDDY